MPSAVRTTLLLACIVLFGGTLFGAAFAKKVKRKVSENSDACKACKRILLSIQSVVVPEIRKAKLHENRKRNLDLGDEEEKVLEKMTQMCTFSNVYYQAELRKECERMIEEHEQDFARSIVHWARSAEDFNLVHSLCHVIARACPSTVNSTASEVVAPREKYRSERPPESIQPGSVVKIVAATWMDTIKNSSVDYVTFQSDAPDELRSKILALLTAVATRLQPCSTIGIGWIDTALNDIPSPYGDYLQGSSLALWRAEDKLRPRLLRDLSRGGLSQFNLLDFIFKSVALPDSFRCMAELSNSVAHDSDALRLLQTKPDDEL